MIYSHSTTLVNGPLLSVVAFLCPPHMDIDSSTSHQPCCHNLLASLSSSLSLGCLDLTVWDYLFESQHVDSKNFPMKNYAMRCNVMARCSIVVVWVAPLLVYNNI